MPEATAATQGAVGDGGPGSGSAPSQPPVQPKAAEAPPSGGAAPAAPSAPQAGAPPAEGAERRTEQGAPETSNRWKEAVKALQGGATAGHERDYQRLKSVDRTLRERYGDRYMDEIARQMAERTAPPQPAQPQPVAQPAPTQAPTPAMGRGMDPRQLEQWATDTFQKLYYGYPATEIVQDPNTGEMQQVQKQVPPDLRQARAVAEDFDGLLRAKGVRPPWDGLFNLGVAQAPQPQAVQPQESGQQSVEEILAQREAARETWELGFTAELQEAATKEFGVDWFNEPVQVEIGGRPVAVPRARALYLQCKPSREYPNGLPFRSGLLAYMPDAVLARYREVGQQAGLARGHVGGAVPTASQAGPPLGSSERQARAEHLQQEGHVDQRWSPEPPKDAARVIRVPSAGGRSSGLPHV